MGNKIREFGKICKLSQEKLKKHLFGRLENFGYNVINEDGFLYAKGELPILLTAHMDTVHEITCRKYDVKKLDEKTIISSKDGIGGDDRCGIYMILEILKAGYRPSILFCEDEEIGGVGSRKFTKTEYIEDLKEMNYLIELDRANDKDAVFYDCGNTDFANFITETTGLKEAFGSFSDISVLSPACDVASVNLSCGYYNAHTTKEYVVMEEMLYIIEVVKKLLDTESAQFEFMEINTSYDYGYKKYFGQGYYDWGYSEYAKIEVMEGLEVCFINDKGEEETEVYWGDSLQLCLGEFMIDHPDKCLNDILDYDVINW